MEKATLDDQEVARYRREGYLVLRRPILADDEFVALRGHFDRRLEALPAGQRPEAMDAPHFSDPALFRWLLAPAVLDNPMSGGGTAILWRLFLFFVIAVYGYAAVRVFDAFWRVNEKS